MTMPFFGQFSLAFLCLVALGTSGCFTRKRPAFPWNTAVLVRPIIPRASTVAAGDATEPAPDLRLEIPPPPRLATAHGVPPRPRVASATAAENSTIENSAEPLIAPQLTAGETSAARQETEQSLEAADRNLAKTRGRNLDASRTDLASKVREFMDDAREAMRNDDWTRARNLAKKAEVLSSELSRSL